MIRAFVTGFPIAHSRSPLVHGHWLKQHGIAGSYERQAVESEDFATFITGLAHGRFAGGNVTLPHKEAAFALADRTTSRAKALGAANTLWLEDGLVWGDNTDGYGFTANLDERAPGWDAPDRLARGAVVLGAGGAARAIVHALIERGFACVVIANRTLSRARTLAGAFGPACRATALAGLDPGHASLVVNTTALGMEGRAADLPVDVTRLAEDCVVSDIVYTPLATPLLVAAATRGLRVVDGLGMLLHQAVPGFERWFGVRPTVTPALRQLIVDDIESAA